MICPKCQHERNTNDDPSIPDTICPACKVVYHKFIQRKKPENSAELPIIRKSSNNHENTFISEEKHENKLKIKRIIITSVFVLIVILTFAIFLSVYSFSKTNVIFIFLTLTSTISWVINKLEISVAINIVVALTLGVISSIPVYLTSKEAAARIVGFENSAGRSKALLFGYKKKNEYDNHVIKAKKSEEKYKRNAAIYAEKRAKEKHERKIYEIAFGSVNESPSMEEININGYEAKQKVKNLPCTKGGTIGDYLDKKASIPAVEDLDWITSSYQGGFQVERHMLLGHLKLTYKWNVAPNGIVKAINGKAIGITK